MDYEKAYDDLFEHLHRNLKVIQDEVSLRNPTRKWGPALFAIIGLTLGYLLISTFESTSYDSTIQEFMYKIAGFFFLIILSLALSVIILWPFDRIYRVKKELLHRIELDVILKAQNESYEAAEEQTRQGVL